MWAVTDSSVAASARCRVRTEMFSSRASTGGDSSGSHNGGEAVLVTLFARTLPFP